MTATVAPATEPVLSTVPRPPASRRLFPDVLRSEWIKLSSVRSTYWTLLVTAIGMVGLGALFTASFVARYDHLSLIDKIRFDPTAESLAGFFFAQLAVAVLGVLVMTGEYSTGSIRSTFGAVPQRRAVLAAKGIVFTAATLVVGVASSLAAFLVGQEVLSGKGLQTHLGAPGVTRAIVGAGLYLAVVGLLALGLGTLLRRTAGAIAAIVGLLWILPGVTAALPLSWQRTIDPYLPSYAGQAIMGNTPMGPDRMLSPWVGLGVFAAYAAVALVAGAIALKRRDA
ncbi:MAG TPA: hypothetical protein VFH45_04195 [Acidimicrobiales bacterium]|nr:hypothetical protein [Acidimicrobiales bacterium]